MGNPRFFRLLAALVLVGIVVGFVLATSLSAGSFMSLALGIGSGLFWLVAWAIAFGALHNHRRRYRTATGLFGFGINLSAVFRRSVLTRPTVAGQTFGVTTDPYDLLFGYNARRRLDEIASALGNGFNRLFTFAGSIMATRSSGLVLNC